MRLETAEGRNKRDKLKTSEARRLTAEGIELSSETRETAEGRNKRDKLKKGEARRLTAESRN
jgi:hypothetical protein